MADQMLKYALQGDSSGATAAFKDVGAAIQRTEDKVDKFTASVDRLKDSLARQVANMSKSSATIERQVAGMAQQGSAASSLTSGMSSLSGAVGLVTGAFAAYGAMEVVGWIKNQAAASIEYGANLQDLSDRLDISTDRLQVYGTWAELSGTSTETLAKAIGKLEVEIANGDKELAKFGVTALDADAAFMQVVAAVEKAPNQFEKARIAQAAFGKGWTEIMPILDAGSTALETMAANASIIDPESIKKMAEMDDKLAELRQSFRALGVEVTAVFGDSFISALDFAARKIKALNEAVTKNSTGDAILRMGGKGVSEKSYDLSNLASLEGVSSKDIGLLLSGKKTKSGGILMPDYSTIKMAPGVVDGAADAYNAALEREALAAQGSRLDKMQQLRAAADRLDADRKAASDEKKAEASRRTWLAELQFQREMRDQSALLNASADQRELIALEQKYAALREKHKANKESILAIELAHQAELQNYYLQQNFAQLGRERDAEMQGPAPAESMPQGEPPDYQFNSLFQSKPAREPSLGEALTQAPDDMQKSWDRRYANSDQVLQEYRAFLEEMQRVSDEIADSTADRFSAVLGPALVDAFTVPQDAIANLGTASLNVLDSIAREVSTVIAKWLILKAISASFGTSSPVGLGMFFAKSIAGHADGTMSSPGGLKYLGEDGPEPYETPFGQRGIATYGLYQVPAGTRVQSSGSGSVMGDKQFHLHVTEADPIQVGEIFRRVVREEIMLLDSEKYRGRQFD